jgi:hypothetical protein
MISFTWRPDGTWRYVANENNPTLSIVIPLSDGSLAPINHLPTTTATKTLGQMTCLTGSSNSAIAQMKVKAKEWIDKARGRRLHRQNVWFLLEKQFWPGVAFWYQ